MGKSSDRTPPDKLPAPQKMAYTEDAITEIVSEQVEIYDLDYAQIVHVLSKITALWAKASVDDLPKKKRK